MMEKLTGVVMERTGSHVVLMTPRGEFKRVKITGRMPDIGEEVRIPVVRRRFFNLPRASWVAVAAAVILLAISGPLLTVMNQQPEVTIGYVSLDINPSVELTVSDHLNVTDARAFNRDGDRVLNGLDVKGVKYKNAIAMIKEKAGELGFIRPGQNSTVLVSIALLPDAKINRAAVQNTLVASVNSIFADKRIKVAAISVPTYLRETASRKGMTAGKYALLIEAVVNAGLPVTEKEMQEKSIVAAISGAGGHPDQIIAQATEENQFDVKEQKYLAIASGNNPELVAAAPAGEQAGDGSDFKPKPDSDTEKTDNTRKLVEPIRRSEGSGEQDTDKGVIAENPNSGEAVPPADSSGGTAVDPGADNPPDSGTDDNTDDNYMGPETPKDQPDSDDEMYKLKPDL